MSEVSKKSFKVAETFCIIVCHSQLVEKQLKRIKGGTNWRLMTELASMFFFISIISSFFFSPIDSRASKIKVEKISTFPVSFSSLGLVFMKINQQFYFMTKLLPLLRFIFNLLTQRKRKTLLFLRSFIFIFTLWPKTRKIFQTANYSLIYLPYLASY